MFCRQCEQTAGGKGCQVSGVCGKNPETASLQDLLIYALKGIAIYGNMLGELGVSYRDTDLFIMEGLFSTVTNVDFDPVRLQEIIRQAYAVKEKTKNLFLEAYKKKNGRDFAGKLPPAAGWVPADTLGGLLEQAGKVGVLSGPGIDEDVRSLRELLLYGLKGMSAYANHAFILGKENSDVGAFLYKGLAALSAENQAAEDLLKLNMEFGRVNLRCLQMLDEAHNERFGTPEPTKVSLGIKKGPAIVVSGHDLLDLEELLRQTEGKGINIYTHSEMLPAHGYPGLKKYRHLAGHYGSAWQNQQKEFLEFPGAILMTTNCIQRPADSYKDRIFTTGLVAWPGVEHIKVIGDKKDFRRLIEKALGMGGFKEDVPGKDITVGFAHEAVLRIADKIIAAVKNGKIKHFFLIGGCDGAKPGRNYYTEFARAVPRDSVILTLACGKFRFNKLDFGEIEGIPRLLDCGQCNDAYSAITIAVKLAEAFGCSVNELPLSLVMYCYEKKAVCILITLMSLGKKNIRLGPSLPSFISPKLLKIMVEKFAIKTVTSAEGDLREI
ncbi:MAG: hydroxylamine reductase, partial [Deltaproteobacteria bacterium]